MIRKLFRGWLALILLSCTPEPCTPTQLVDINVACFAEVTLACRNHPEPSAEGEAETASIAVCPPAKAIFGAKMVL